MTFSSEDFRFRIDSLAASRPAYGPFLAFLGQVRDLQDAAVLDAPPLAPPPSAEEASTHLAGGFPLVDVQSIDFSGVPVGRTAGKIIALLQEREGESGEDLTPYAFLGEPGDADAARAFAAAAAHDGAALASIAEARGLNEGILTFVARAAVKPFFFALRGRVDDLLPDDVWGQGTCPCCGNPPAMERLEGEGGKRLLGCSLCEHEWRFPRMKCPICGTEDQKSLRRFADESGGEASVFLCDACHHYVKTIDSRLLPEGEKVVLPVEEVVTLHLDIVARRLGYLPPSVGSFAFPVGADQA